MFVSAQIILGDLPGTGPILKYWLDGLSVLDPSAQAYVAGFMAAAASPQTLTLLFHTIACHQLWGSWRVGREIRDGALGENACDGVEMDRPYDSAEWSVGVPITYPGALRLRGPTS